MRVFYSKNYARVLQQQITLEINQTFFASESSNFNKITLVEKDLILEKNEDIADIINRMPLLLVTQLMTELGT